MATRKKNETYYAYEALRQLSFITGCNTEAAPKIFSSFLSSCLEFQHKILPTHLVILCTHNSVIITHLVYCVLKLSADSFAF